MILDEKENNLQRGSDEHEKKRFPTGIQIRINETHANGSDDEDHHAEIFFCWKNRSHDEEACEGKHCRHHVPIGGNNAALAVLERLEIEDLTELNQHARKESEKRCADIRKNEIERNEEERQRNKNNK